MAGGGKCGPARQTVLFEHINESFIKREVAKVMIVLVEIDTSSPHMSNHT